MSFIIAGRRMGKTTLAVNYAKKLNLPIITFNSVRASQIIEEFDYSYVYSWQEWDLMRHGFNPQTKVVLDDAEFILSDMIGRRIALMTATGETNGI